MAVTFNSSFYDTLPGSGVTEIKWAKGLPSIGACEYGVKGAGDWKVTAVAGQPFTLAIAPGSGWGHGVYDTTDQQETIQVATLASGTRWDFIGTRRDWKPAGGGPSAFASIINAGGKQLPATRKNDPGNEDDQPLALVQWTAGQTQPTTILDLRCWAGNGGVEAVDTLALTYLDKPGAAVKVGPTLWRYELGVNQLWVWKPYTTTKYDFGQGSETKPIIISRNVSVNTSQYGDGYFYFPEPMPNALVACVPTDATHPDYWGQLEPKWITVYSDRTRLCFRLYDGATGNVLANKTNVNIAFIATGY